MLYIRTDETNPVEKFKRGNIDVGGMNISFMRTVRVPQGKLNDLPAGLGTFPVYKVADFRSGAPKEWKDDAYFMPMYRQEAMWMSFARQTQNPKALVVGAGNINAITGKPFDPTKAKEYTGERRAEADLDIRLEKTQNYVVIPPQPWLDGWKAEDGKIYQFVAAELGSGETVEGQITGEEKSGGIQLIVYDAKPGKKLIHETRPHEYILGGSYAKSASGTKHILCCRSMRSCSVGSVASMGLGRGGEISQKIYPDPYGLDVWNEKPTAVDLVHLVSSDDFRQLTGHAAPDTPVTYEKYQQLGLPWFGIHDQKYADTKGSGIFDKLKPVGEGKAIK